MLDKEMTKQKIDELTAVLSVIQKTLNVATELLSQENPDHEKLFALHEGLLQSKGTAVYAGREIEEIAGDVHWLAYHQKHAQYNLIPYAKSITYRAIHKESEWEMLYDGDACHVVSGAVPLFDGYGFSVKMASDTSDMASTRTVALSNLVIEVEPKDEMQLNDFGLVSRVQLEKMDHMLAVLEQMGNRPPKTAEEIFAKAFVKPFQSKYMEHPGDIMQGALQRGARRACHALHKKFAEKLSAEQYRRLFIRAQALSPVPVDRMWQEQNLVR